MDLTKEQVAEMVKTTPGVIIRQDSRWRYPQQGDNEQKCPMLKFMFDIEYIPGILIFIPQGQRELGKQK